MAQPQSFSPLTDSQRSQSWPFVCRERLASARRWISPRGRPHRSTSAGVTIVKSFSRSTAYTTARSAGNPVGTGSSSRARSANRGLSNGMSELFASLNESSLIPASRRRSASRTTAATISSRRPGSRRYSRNSFWGARTIQSSPFWTRTPRPWPSAVASSFSLLSWAATTCAKEPSSRRASSAASSPSPPQAARTAVRQKSSARERTRTPIGCRRSASRCAGLGPLARDLGGAYGLELVVEPGACFVLVHGLGVHELAGEDLLRLHEHLLLAGREPLLLIAEREVPYDLGELEDVAGLHLVAVVLEAAVPVLRHLRAASVQHLEDALHHVLVDYLAEPDAVGVLRRDVHGHVVVKDLDRQVLALLTQNRSRLLLHHGSSAMVGIDDLIADLVQASPPLNQGVKNAAQDACGTPPS